jgi:hypothetical protein
MVCASGLGGVAGTGWADATCAGNACSVVTLSADGCQWTNKGDRAVRLSLSGGGVARMVTVLGPGEGYKESDKKHCAAGEGDGHYDASFAKLASIPPEGAAKTPIPRAKPAAPVVAVAPAAAAASAGAVASVEAGVAPPRAKPAPSYPPLPRAKPQAPAAVTALATPVAAVAPAAAIEPAPADSGVVACSRDCPPILFKVIDNCLWVLNLNPRRVAFAAEVGGKRTTLMLEAADGAKADARSAAIASGKATKDEAALHMRLADPFQSAGSGIPIFRARLGPAGACVKSREEIAKFSANYVK